MPKETKPYAEAQPTLAEQRVGVDFVREILASALREGHGNRGQLNRHIGNGAPEEREAWRNGYRRRDW